MLDPSKMATRQDLFDHLDQRGIGREEREAFDEKIWALYGAEGAVLVTDLSGFTRTTRVLGILHFLAIFRRFQRTCAPILNKHGGSLVKQEADDVVGLFETVEDAMRAALEIQEECCALNRDRPEDERIELSVGIDYGRFLKLADDAFGDPVNVAYKLGEDLAGPGEILVSAPAYARAAGGTSELLSGVSVEARSTTLGGVTIDYHVIRHPSMQRGEGGRQD